MIARSKPVCGIFAPCANFTKYINSKKKLLQKMLDFESKGPNGIAFGPEL
jgi:hypothetical protein